MKIKLSQLRRIIREVAEEAKDVHPAGNSIDDFDWQPIPTALFKPIKTAKDLRRDSALMYNFGLDLGHAEDLAEAESLRQALATRVQQHGVTMYISDDPEFDELFDSLPGSGDTRNVDGENVTRMDFEEIWSGGLDSSGIYTYLK